MPVLDKSDVAVKKLQAFLPLEEALKLTMMRAGLYSIGSLELANFLRDMHSAILAERRRACEVYRVEGSYVDLIEKQLKAATEERGELQRRLDAHRSTMGVG